VNEGIEAVLVLQAVEARRASSLLLEGEMHALVAAVLLRMAGLWSTWRNPANGEEIQSCTVLTCEPNAVMAEVHNRMPVILDESDWPKWLGEEPATEQELLALLSPCPDERLKIWRVDNKVGNVRNTGPELILPLEETLL
jgi:putative SOS response-associated peptidase YedK